MIGDIEIEIRLEGSSQVLHFYDAQQSVPTHSTEQRSMLAVALHEIGVLLVDDSDAIVRRELVYMNLLDSSGHIATIPAVCGCWEGIRVAVCCHPSVTIPYRCLCVSALIDICMNMCVGM